MFQNVGQLFYVVIIKTSLLMGLLFISLPQGMQDLWLLQKYVILFPFLKKLTFFLEYEKIYYWHPFSLVKSNTS
jgi:hypothetical protein